MQFVESLLFERKKRGLEIPVFAEALSISSEMLASIESGYYISEEKQYLILEKLRHVPEIMIQSPMAFRSIRYLKGLTISDLSKLSKFDESLLSKLESGEIVPTTKMVETLNSFYSYLPDQDLPDPEQIRTLRLSNHLTIEELAGFINFPVINLYLYEAGQICPFVGIIFSIFEFIKKSDEADSFFDWCTTQLKANNISIEELSKKLRFSTNGNTSWIDSGTSPSFKTCDRIIRFFQKEEYYISPRTLRNKRISLGLTVSSLSKKTNISEFLISSYESGKVVLSDVTQKRLTLFLAKHLEPNYISPDELSAIKRIHKFSNKDLAIISGKPVQVIKNYLAGIIDNADIASQITDAFSTYRP